MANVIEIIIKQTGAGNAIADAGKALGGLGGSAKGVTGALSGVGGALGNVATVAGGIVAANIFGKIVDGITGFVSVGLSAVSSSQQLETSLKALLTSNLMYEQSTETVTQAVTKQIMSQDELGIKQDELTAKLATQRAAYQEQQEQIRQLTAQYGENGLVVIKTKAAHDELALKIKDTEREIAGLVATETSYSTTTRQVYNQTMSQADAFKVASDQTQDLLDFVSKLAVVSPFETETVEQTTKYAIAAGMGVDATKEFVPAFLDLAGAVGITSESLGFAADQLFQVKKMGKLTEVDLRQLRRLGIDLSKVIGVEMGMSVEEFNAQAEKSPEIFDELFAAVTRFSKNTFAGTSKEMALSVKGLQSTFSDIFVIGSRTFLRPLVDAMTPTVAAIAGKLSDFVFGGEVAAIGQGLADTLMGGMAAFQSGGVSGLLEMIGITPAAMELFDKIVTSVTSLAGLISSYFAPALSSLSDPLSMVNTVLEFLNEHFIEFQGALLGIGAVLGAGLFAGLVAGIMALLTPINLIIVGAALLGAAWAGNWGNIQGITAQVWAVVQPVLAQLWTWLQVQIPIAIQFLSDFWTNTLMPAMMAAGAWITGTLIPTLAIAWDWLQVQMPIAIQLLADFWTNILLPAMMAAGAWITGTLIPILTDIWNWLGVNVPMAIQTLSDFWSNTLLPAMTAVWSFHQNSLMPLWVSFIAFVNAVVMKSIQALAGLWQNILLPALTEVWQFMQDNVMPIFQSAGEQLSGDEGLGPILRNMAEEILPVFKKGMDGVTSAIEKATSFFKALASAVSGFELPPTLLGHSPSPMENSLVGIANAANLAASAMDTFGSSVGQFQLPNVIDPHSPTPFEIALTGIANAANAAGQALGTMTISQGTLDSLLGLNRHIADNANIVSIAQRRLGHFFEVRNLEEGKRELANRQITAVFLANQAAILGAADPTETFRQLADQAGILGEGAGFSGTPGAIAQGGFQAFLQEFQAASDSLNKLQQAAYIQAGRTALTIGSQLNSIITGAADILDERVKTLEGLVEGGDSEVTFEGMIISATEAQERLNQALEEQAAIQEQLRIEAENEKKLSFLEKQLSLVETLGEAGLNVQDVLGGLQLGLGASIPDMIAATNQLVSAMITQVNADLQGITGGASTATGAAAGLGFAGGTGPLGFEVPPGFPNDSFPLRVQSGERVLVAPRGQSIEDLAGRGQTTNYYFNQTVNTRADSSTVIGDFNVMRGLLGA